jgi:hypothetical protein
MSNSGEESAILIKRRPTKYMYMPV